MGCSDIGSWHCIAQLEFLLLQSYGRLLHSGGVYSLLFAVVIICADRRHFFNISLLLSGPASVRKRLVVCCILKSHGLFKKQGTWFVHERESLTKSEKDRRKWAWDADSEVCSEKCFGLD